MNRRFFLTAAGATGLAAPSASQAVATRSLGPGLLVAAVDAPAAEKRVAAYRCDGVADQEQIQAAIASLGSNGGQVQLSSGTFFLTDAVRLTNRVLLSGRGRATSLRAAGTWTSFDGARQGALIESATNSVDKAGVSHLALDGARYQGHDIGGIYFNTTSNADFDEGPDAANWFSDLYIFHTRQHGVHFAGSRGRATKASRIRVYNVGQEGVNVAHGFLIDTPDGTYDQLESGSASGAGFWVDGTNNRFTNCKAWYSDLSGWEIRKGRCMFSACESQDNEQHGFYIGAGPNSLTGCHADSNSWNGDSPTSAYDGFHIPWGNDIQLVGCSAYDKNEGGRGYWQRHGFYVGSSANRIQILGTARDNASDGLTGPGVDNADNTMLVAST